MAHANTSFSQAQISTIVRSALILPALRASIRAALAVAPAWLARTEGLAGWRLHTAGGEVVTVTLELDAKGAWRELWLTGPVRDLGVVHPDPSPLLRLSEQPAPSSPWNPTC